MKSKYSTTRLDNRLKRVVEDIAEQKGVPQIHIINSSLEFGLPFALAEMEHSGSDFRLSTVIAVAKTYLNQTEQPDEIKQVIADAITSVDKLRDLMVQRYAITASGHSV